MAAGSAVDVAVLRRLIAGGASVNGSGRGGWTPLAGEYNRLSIVEYERIRDFIVLHYHVTRRQDTPFWRSCRAMDIPDSLRHRLDLFRETGRVFRVPNELFAENSWIQVMLGQGIEPQQHHPVADLMGDEELSRFLDGIKSSIEKTVAQLPAHQTYVEQYCRARSE